MSKEIKIIWEDCNNVGEMGTDGMGIIVTVHARPDCSTLTFDLYPPYEDFDPKELAQKIADLIHKEWGD